MDARIIFEHELQRRGLHFDIDSDSGRHAVEIGGGRMFVSLDNLQRDLSLDQDVGRVARFVDAIVAAAGVTAESIAIDGLYWCLERNDYDEPPAFRVPVSDVVDRVLVHLSRDGQLVSWIAPDMLAALGLSEEDAGAAAFANLGRALAQATIESRDIDGVRLGHLVTALPFKASLMLAPNLQEVVEPVLGWPLMAVAPDRDFLYLWASRHAEFANRVGGVVVREYSTAAYPLSTEVWQIDDDGVYALGAFPTKQS